MTRTAVLLVAVAVAAAACGDPPVSGGGGDPSTYSPERDPLVNTDKLQEPYRAEDCAEDEWLFCTLDGNPATISPLFASSTYEFRVNGFLFDGPFTFGPDLKWKVNEVFTESLEISEDRKVWTLKLRPGLKWHDGHPYTAHDIAWSWTQIMDDRVPVTNRSGPDELESVEAVDDLTVRIVHKRPLPTSKWNAGIDTVPKHLYEVGKEEDPSLKASEYYSKLNRNPIGTGPYRFVEWIENDKIVFERWEDYPGPKPHFKRIVCRIIPDQNSQLLAFESEDVDEFRMDAKQFAEESVRSKRFSEVGAKAKADQWSFSYICWNMDGSNPFFNDVRVRRAMTHATNIPLMLEKLLYNLYTPCYGIYHPDSPMFNEEIELIPYDLAAAEALLEEAGWKRNKDTGWREKSIDGRMVQFSFKMLYSQGTPISVQTATTLQADLRRIGVEMKQEVIEWATYQERTRKHEFQASMAGWGTGVDPDFSWNVWHSTQYADLAGRNYGGYSNKRVDELLLLGRQEFDEAKRMRHYAEMQKIIYDEQPYTFLWNPPVLWGFNKRIRGVTFSPRGVWNFDPSYLAWWVHRDEQMHAMK